MKQRFLMLLMTVLMMLGVTQAAFANDVQYYEGTGIYYISHNNGDFTDVISITVKATIENDFLKGLFIADNGDTVEFWTNGFFDGEYLDLDESTPVGTSINGIVSTHISGDCQREEDGSISWYAKGGARAPEGDYLLTEYFFRFTLVEVESPTEPEVQLVSSGFTGTGVSDRGDYNLYIAGYFDKELTDGVHELALSDITSQTIAVVAHNNANGVNRNMNQSTIEEITVTVSGGEVTEMRIRGRVQTNGGTLDRYTAIIQN